MKIICFSVGKKHGPEFKAAIDIYVKRLSGYASFGFEYIASSDKQQESKAILKRLKTDDFVVVLDERGQQLDNQQLAEQLDRLQNNGVKTLVFIIGGAYGVDRSVLAQANLVIGFSRLVYPHQIMRLLLVEQLYRSFNLLAGGRYHHD